MTGADAVMLPDAGMLPDAAVVLAGGRGSRLGGRDKPALLIGDRSLLDIALLAVAGCPVVVVGPTRPLPVGLLSAHEVPPGSGPAAAVAAGWLALPELPATAIIAVLAADLPGITRATVARLCAALSDAAVSDASGSDAAVSDASGSDASGSGAAVSGAAGSRASGSGAATGVDLPRGAVLVDAGGHRQYLIGVWRHGALGAAITRQRQWAGASLRRLLAPIDVLEVPALGRETADVDTPDDWRQWQA
ncbi:MAG TPA: NTP transferase domain-containing protein [Nakamurella sp.]